MRHAIKGLGAFLLVSGCLVGTGRAEIALLRNGQSLEVQGFRMEGDRVTLQLAGGGEIALRATEVLEIRRQPVEPLSPIPPPAAAPAPVASGSEAPASAPAAPAIAPPPAAAQTLEVADGSGGVVLPAGAVFDADALREMASKLAKQHGVDESLVQAVIQVESRYNAFAVSPRGAMGLMQLMPKTAARFDVENAFDPVENVDAGVRYLKELLERYSGQRRLALAAYNAGEEAVERYSGIPPYRETIEYVRKVQKIAGR